jgi:hypothetical protein
MVRIPFFSRNHRKRAAEEALEDVRQWQYDTVERDYGMSGKVPKRRLPVESISFRCYGFDAMKGFRSDRLERVVCL